MAERVGLGVVGLGMWAEVLAQAVARSAKLRLVSGYTRAAETRAAFAARYGCRPAASYEALLADPEVEGVLVTSPNQDHPAHACAAAGAGKHVFLEKPMANTVREAKAILRACQQAGVVLSIGHEFRRAPAHRAMKAMGEAGELGRLLMAEGNFSTRAGLATRPGHWKWRRENIPGGPMTQVGIHQFDTLCYLLGRPARVTACFSRVATPAEMDDVTQALVEFESGALGYVGAAYSSPITFFTNLYGTEANLFFAVDTMGEGHTAHHVGRSGELWAQKAGAARRERVPLREGDVLVEELEEFAECIRLGKRPEVDGEQGLLTAVLVLAAVRSARERRPVAVQELLDEA